MAGGVSDHERPPVPDDIHARLTDLGPVFGKRQVQVGYVFGSVGRGEVGNDVDLAALPDGPFDPRLVQEVSAALGTERVHLVDLSSAAPFLQEEIVTTGEAIYSSDAEGHARFEESVLAHVLDDDPGRRELRSRWNVLNGLTEQLWPYREATAEVFENASERRWTVERGLRAALTLVAQILDHLRTQGALAPTETGEQPRLFSRELSSEFASLRQTRQRLEAGRHPPASAELAERCRHALRWLPVFLREVHLWLEAGSVQDPGQSE